MPRAVTGQSDYLMDGEDDVDYEGEENEDEDEGGKKQDGVAMLKVA